MNKIRPVPIQAAPTEPGLVFVPDLGWRFAEPLIVTSKDEWPQIRTWVSPVDGETEYPDVTHWLPEPSWPTEGPESA